MPGSGVVCGKFGQERENGLVCNGAWHGKCYKQDAKHPFPVLRAWDLEESIVGPEELEEDDPDRFKCARDGNHLMCPFQCDLSHFYNIQRRWPGAKVQDGVLLMCICQANLDAFWSQESTTVFLANRREASRVLSVCARLGLTNHGWRFIQNDDHLSITASISRLRKKFRHHPV